MTVLRPVICRLLALCWFSAAAQDIPIGAWRVHAAYGSMQTVAVAQNRVYAGATGSFFAYETDSRQATPLSKLDGFSGTAVSRLAYEPQSRTLIVAYNDGTIDLLRDNNLLVISDVANQNSISASKQTSHIYLQKQFAYLSYDFGVVVVDLDKRQIRETYRNLGNGGSTLRVSGTAVSGNQIFLATGQGVLVASLSANLQDFNNWRTVPQTEGVPGGAAQHIATHAGQLYAAFSNQGIFRLENNRWQKIENLPAEPVLFFKESRQKLLIGYRNKIVSFENAKPATLTHPLIGLPQEAEYDANGKLWIADAANGLVSDTEGGFRTYAPNGTAANTFQRLARWQNEVVALPGGYAGNFAPRRDSSGFSVFTANGWQNSIFGNNQTPLGIPKTTDLLSAAYNPVTQEFFVGSFGGGLLVRKSGGAWQPVREPNAPPADAQITGLATGADGKLWAAVYGASSAQASLYARTPEGAWRGFTFSNSVARQPVSLLLDDNNYAWMPLAAGGIWVFDAASNRSKLLNTVSGQGGLPDNRVYALAKDAQGQIWAGTGRGAAYFFNASEVFGNQPVDAITPVFEGRQLLRDEAVTALRMDGGNRKWFGTRNGAWLFDADVVRQLAHFTVRNTPLLSDNIIDLEIQPVTGEVFFATDAGLVSYRGAATEATLEHGNVQVFPNPVRPGFEGTVGISGLAANCTVKITDAAGRLVFQTRANGGTAVWNVRDYRGRRATSGVYLIFSLSDDGTEKSVAKMAVVE